MNQYRRKLLNAILFFASKVKRLNTTKLCKLLYFLDFTHVQQTGYPSIGLRYHAFEQGPVPKDFWLEIKNGVVPNDFKDKIAIIVSNPDDIDKDDYREYIFIKKCDPDLKVFTPRERKILENLAYIYDEATARDMSEVTHLENSPWDKTFKHKGKCAPIDYKLAFDSKTPDIHEAEQIIQDHFEVMNNFTLFPYYQKPNSKK